MKLFRALFSAFVILALSATLASATAYDLRSSSEIDATATKIGGPVFQKTIDFTVNSLTSADYAKICTVPAGVTIDYVTLDVVTAESATTMTLDLGDAADVDGYLDGSSIYTADVRFNSASPGNVRCIQKYDFGDIAVAASQSAAAWGTDTGTDVGGVIKGYVVPFAGYVRAITVNTDDTCTSGGLTADATINTSATGLQATLDSVTNTVKDTTTQAFGLDPVAAGDIIGAKVTTTSVWAPTSSNGVVVSVFVESDPDGAKTAYSLGKYYSTADYLRISVPGTCAVGKVTVRVHWHQ